MALSPSSTKPEKEWPFPLEIYGQIFQFLGVRDLARLCRVSSKCQSQAEACLYRSVSLSLVSHRLLLSWCRTIVQCERRARKVRTLIFPAFFRLPTQENSPDLVYDSIAQAFKVIVNLKVLRVDIGARGRDCYPSLRPATFDGCSFHLSELLGDLPQFPLQDVQLLLRSHPGSHYWAPDNNHLTSITGTLPLHIIPGLRDLRLIRPDLATHLRPLRRLAWHLGCSPPIDTMQKAVDIARETIPHLALFRDSLCELYLTHRLGSGYPAVEVVTSVAQHLPNLRVFTLDYLVSWNRWQPLQLSIEVDEHRKLLEAISQFKRLETLVLDIDMQILYLHGDQPVEPANPLERESFWQEISPAQCRQVATDMMVKCPSLRAVSFPIKLGTGPPKNLCYFRAADGQANLVPSDLIDTSRWWKR
ncbi:hypothetical protein JAAARDRAFT_202317 [Jaapia argillacea MUCL 33604]|uniref:F-box domain-containing protein n=1 Tax=Jaapia argillacea MUCL 33604 TaxID=933084 RepID=A0A067QDE0_9AGAM|nr:hypothetical protein JAAARDRAFT_202317 [Jaapia argillacea MUCL 33604]